MNETMEVQDDITIRTAIHAGDQMLGSGGATSGPETDRSGYLVAGH